VKPARLLVPLLFALASPGGAAVFREDPLPAPSRGPTAIAGTAQYGLWFLGSLANRIGRRNPDGSFEEFLVPTPDSGLSGMTAYAEGAFGRLGFTEFAANKIGRIDPSGRIDEFPIPTAGSGPRGIAVGDSHSFWFTEFNANKIGRLSLQGQFMEYPIGAGSGPVGIVWGPPAEDALNGEAWFTEFRANRISRLDENGRLRRYSIPTADSGPTAIVSVSGFGDPAIWFIEFNANKIGRITPDGTITEFSIPTPDSGPTDLVGGSDGIWFTESRANKIGRLNLDGTFTEFPIPTANSWPAGITSELWFTERDGNKVSRLGSDSLVAIGAGFSGNWDTDFELVNAEGRAVGMTVRIPGPRACGICFNPTTTVDVPAHGTFSLTARDVPFVPEGAQTFYVSLSLPIGPEELPTTRARIVNRARPTQAIEIPVVRLSTLERMNPSVLAFPGATRTPTAHSNLVLSEVGLVFPVGGRIEAFDAAGAPRGVMSFSLYPGQSVFLVDVLRQLGVAGLEGGQIRVTKTEGIGLLWGLLATLTDDGGVAVSVGANP